MRRAIEAINLGKLYQIGRRSETLIDEIRGLWQRNEASKRRELWAVRHVNFEVMEGEIIGIVGRNGAGKSTLLKIISGVTEPTEGEATIKGRVGSLLEVGIGFHPNLSGRENIFLSGAILGAKRKYVEKRFEEIVDFSELQNFLDVPIRYYSSGMHVRLGFSVAVHLQQDIIIIDEALAVGDAAFQLKCTNRLQQLVDAGVTILLVSHNADTMAKCHRVLYLANGQVKAFGDSKSIMSEYLTDIMPAAENRSTLKERLQADDKPSRLLEQAN